MVEYFSGIMIYVLWIAYAIGLFVLYHKVFSVYYFSLSKGLLGELITIGFISFILTLLTFAYWWVALIVIGIIVLLVYQKRKNNN